MPGTHEPPSKRSFYLSMGSSTLKAAVVVGLVVGGIVVIANAFPNAGSGSVPNGPSPSVSPSKTPHVRRTKTPAPPPTASLQGVPIEVFNTTTTPLLAAKTAHKLVNKYGVVSVHELQASTPLDVTTIYYRTPKDQTNAQFLADDFFTGATVSKLPSNNSEVDKQATIAIYVGNDYASTVK